MSPGSRSADTMPAQVSKELATLCGIPRPDSPIRAGILKSERADSSQFGNRGVKILPGVRNKGALPMAASDCQPRTDKWAASAIDGPPYLCSRQRRADARLYAA